MEKLTVGSLFAGIGGFDLGLERTGGFEVRFQVEIDEYCRRVLEKHWPHVKRYGDIRTVTDCERVDVLCGGFPCQDISNAGRREGIDGERSGLWSEFARLIRLVRPRYVIVENVAALLGRGMGRVLGDLSESGYDAEWDCLPACAFGADHIRDRLFIIAYPNSGRERFHGREFQPSQEMACHATYANQSRLPLRSETRKNSEDARRFFTRAGFTKRVEIEFSRLFRSYRPVLGRGVHGIPNRIQRIKGLGNAIVPQIAEWLGNRILEAEGLIHSCDETTAGARSLCP